MVVLQLTLLLVRVGGAADEVSAPTDNDRSMMMAGWMMDAGCSWILDGLFVWLKARSTNNNQYKAQTGTALLFWSCRVVTHGAHGARHLVALGVILSSPRHQHSIHLLCTVNTHGGTIRWMCVCVNTAQLLVYSLWCFVSWFAYRLSLC